MRKLTKFDLLSAAILVAVLIGVAIAASPVTSASSLLVLYSLIAIAVIVYLAVEVVLLISGSRPADTLNEEVSDRLSNTIKNTVTIAWLLVVALFFALLIRHHGKLFALALLAPAIAAIIGGRFLQVKIGSTSLLPYSFTFLLALVSAFVIERLGGWLK
jgi:cobalamin synthase